MKRVLVVMVALLAMVAFVSGVMAQAPAPEKAAPAPAPAPEKAKPADKPKADKPKAMKFAGAVSGYEAGKMIKVKGSKDKVMTFDVMGDTKMKGEVKEGAKVTVMYKKDGDKMVATSITVSAEKKSSKKAAEKPPEKAPVAPAAPEKK
jgi:hypothetical protein